MSIKLFLATGLLAVTTAVTATTAAAQNQPYQQPYQPPPNHTGLTFEANLGYGVMRVDSDNGGSESEGSLGGLDLGIGGFINPKLAITARIAGATYVEDDASLTQVFFGPSLQYWVSDAAWIGGGIGLGGARIVVGDEVVASERGFGLDLRAGYTFNPTAKHSFNVSGEITPAFLDGGSITGIVVLLGYQTL